ncbi:hypothetical protein SE959_27335 [Escherichia coli]|nr:hypothetical protein [Escherichia coli]
MYAISFDLTVADTEKHHPKGVSQAYNDISSTLKRYGFERIQEACTQIAMKIWQTFFRL